MSDPATIPKELTVLEYEGLRGRLAALEILAAQSWVFLLKALPDDDREPIIEGALIQQEIRFERLHPVAQRVAVESAENILSSALVTARQR